MKLRYSDLPIKVRQAYKASAIKPREALSLEKFGAEAEIEAIAVVDHPNGVIYATQKSSPRGKMRSYPARNNTVGPKV